MSRVYLVTVSDAVAQHIGDALESHYPVEITLGDRALWPVTEITEHGHVCCCSNCPWGGDHGWQDANDMRDWSLAKATLKQAGKLPASLGPTLSSIRVSNFVEDFPGDEPLATFAARWEPRDG